MTERFANSITLEWENMNKAWQYELQINGGVSDSVSDVSSDTIRKVVTSLQPGSQYDFNLTTVFAGLRSTPYTNFTVTGKKIISVRLFITFSCLFSMSCVKKKKQVHAYNCFLLYFSHRLCQCRLESYQLINQSKD